ncbi:MAG: dihydropteridine reductase [Clostridia bacterium]|nr:dihydropteridine reductase [Clostridia bacterium]
MDEQNDVVTKIREGYIPRERTKLDELRALDKKVKLLPSVLAYVFGSVAALVLGVGMCLAMQVIGAGLASPTVLMAVGVVVGCAGIALCAVNYFIYKAFLKSRKNKYGGEILALSNQLLNEE